MPYDQKRVVDTYITLRGLQTRLSIAEKQVITQQELLERYNT